VPASARGETARRRGRSRGDEQAEAVAGSRGGEGEEEEEGARGRRKWRAQRAVGAGAAMAARSERGVEESRDDETTQPHARSGARGQSGRLGAAAVPGRWGPAAENENKRKKAEMELWHAQRALYHTSYIPNSYSHRNTYLLFNLFQHGS